MPSQELPHNSKNGTKVCDTPRNCLSHRFGWLNKKNSFMWTRKISVCCSMVTTVCSTSEYRTTHSDVRINPNTNLVNVIRVHG